MPRHLVLLSSLLQVTTWCVAADVNDWVNVNYVLDHPHRFASGDTSSSQKTIVSRAESSSQYGPWSITSSTVRPPSGNAHEYLSWAPYHWPNCKWCNKGNNHLAHTNATNDPSNPSGDENSQQNSLYASAYCEGTSAASNDTFLLYSAVGETPADSRWFPVNPSAGPNTNLCSTIPTKAAMFIPRSLSSQFAESSTTSSGPAHTWEAFANRLVESVPTLISPSLPLTLPVASSLSTIPLSPSTTRRPVAGTPAPADAHAKTTSTRPTCTPSPSRSIAPSATWTTCPYAVRDGKVNPDVKTLIGPNVLQDMPESVLYNGIAYALKRSPAASQNAAKFIETFFIRPATAMSPNMNFGQLVRGPGMEHQMGTFTGILDMRGLVKIVNTVLILKSAKSPDWTTTRDEAFTTWVKSYGSWLQASAIGKETASKANNHLTFYVSQLAATQIHTGDTRSALATLTGYFKNQFLDQIAASGEQPFEAIRTRPYHYRSFNLEAMITNAKLGDQLGQNFWTAKSKYGATIQTALDYAMAQKPGDEDIGDILPHVAAVAAAYGDPKGKYRAFLEKHLGDYQKEAWWFYDQTAALPNSPAAGKAKRRSEGDQDDADPGSVGLPFSCPAVFENVTRVELEDGLFVTCPELEPFYARTLSNVAAAGQAR